MEQTARRAELNLRRFHSNRCRQWKAGLRIIAWKLPALTAQDLVDKIGDDFVKGSPPPPRSRSWKAYCSQAKSRCEPKSR